MKVFSLLYSAQPFLKTQAATFLFAILKIPMSCNQSHCSSGRHYSPLVAPFIYHECSKSCLFHSHAYTYDFKVCSIPPVSVQGRVYACEICCQGQMFPCKQVVEVLLSLRSALLLSLQMASALQSGTALSAGPKVLRVNWYPPRVLTTSMTSTTKVRSTRGLVWKNQWPSVGIKSLTYVKSSHQHQPSKHAISSDSRKLKPKAKLQPERTNKLLIPFLKL